MLVLGRGRPTSCSPGRTFLHDLADLFGGHVLDLIVGHGRQLLQLLSAAERRARGVFEKSTGTIVSWMHLPELFGELVYTYTAIVRYDCLRDLCYDED